MKKVLITTLLTIIIIAQTSVAQRRYNPINGHLYEKFDTPMTWNDAKAYCESLGGYLATVTSQEEQDWIWNTLYPYRCNLGATDAEEEGVWKWVTGEPWNYTNWDGGEPGGGINENIICWWSTNGRWHDAPEYWEMGFVCEYELSNEVFVSPDGSDEDGKGTTENPYRTIQHGIDMSPRKDAVVHVLPGTYQENITLSSDLMVLGSGADQTIIMAANGIVVSATNVIEVTLAGFTIDGQGAASNGILCGGATTMMMINDNIIIRATKGIRCSDTANVLIQSNTIRQNVETGVLCDGSANVDIKNNTIEQNGYGIYCDGWANAIIQNNTFSQNAVAGITCSGSVNVTIDDNNLEGNGYGIECSNVQAVKIQQNHIGGQKYAGIQCSGASNPNIYNNIIENSQHTGIQCYDSSAPTIKSNSILNNGGSGIYCYYNSPKPLIESNIISGNVEGILCSSTSAPLIYRNIITNNSFAGIECWEEANPTIGCNLEHSNTIENNQFAIANYGNNIIHATFNYWGTTNKGEISAMMHNGGSGSIDFIPFVSNEIIGDVSGNGTISAYDAALILQFTVGLIDKLPVSMSKSPQYSAPRDYELRLPNLTAKPGERIHAPIVISDATGLSYGGVIIKYDPSVLKVIDVAALGMLSGSYWKANTRADEVRFAFATPLPMEEIPPNPPLKKGGRGDLLMIDFEVLPNTTGRESPLIFDTVEIPESRNIKTINGSVTILPERTMLLQNYPNPFNPETWIPFQLAQDAVVILRIYNQKGQLVRTLYMGAKPAGMYTSKGKAAYWDGRDAAGEKVANGVYFYNLHAGDFSATRKLVLVK